MVMKLLIITFFIGFSEAASGCADISRSTQSPVLPARAVEPISAGSLVTEAFPYKAYPREVLVQYDDKDVVLKANASTKAKGLPFWDKSVLAQYKADMSAARECIFAAQLGEGLEIISASSVVPPSDVTCDE
jgi:hypothetical protein